MLFSFFYFSITSKKNAGSLLAASIFFL